MVKTLLVAALLTLALAAPTQAQLVGKPLFRVPGVVNYQSLGTVISCTNTDDVAATFTVEIYNNTGTMVATGTSGTLGFQHTTSLSSRAITAIDTVNLAAPATVARGSAKIFSTSKSLMCSAYLVDSVDSPPASMASLQVVPGTKQK